MENAVKKKCAENYKRTFTKVVIEAAILKTFAK